MAEQRFDLIKVENFSHKGVSRSRSWTVGKAMAMRRGGFMIFVPEGVALSGRIVMMPERASYSEVDLIEAYASAAEEFGL